MEQVNVHYEVLGLRGTSWTIISVVDDQNEAIGVANASRANYRAVKVMRERFDAGSNTYRSGQVYFSGAKPRPSKYDSDAPAEICWKVEDFYSYEGRRSISRLLRSELLQWGITATELIHSLEYVERLQDHGTALQRAVQQTAIAQVRETGQDVQHRIKQIYELIDRGTTLLRRDQRTLEQFRIENDDLDPLIAAIKETESRTYLLNVALVAYLVDATSYGEKMSRVMGLVKHEHPAWVHEVADTFVGELLSVEAVVHQLVGKRETVRDELIATAKLSRGRLPEDDEAAGPGAHSVNKLLQSNKMPFANQALQRYLAGQLKGKRQLVGGDIAVEAQAVREILDCLRTEDGNIVGGMNMFEAASDRCARWLHPEAIAELLNIEESPERRALLLIELEPNVFGAANKRKLGDYVVPILISPQAELYFTREEGPISARLKRVYTMQQRVLESGFQDTYIRRLSEKLDDYCCKILRKSRLFERIMAAESSVADKCIGLLKMLTDGFFTLGRADAEARDIARRLMMSSDFAVSFFRGVRGKEEKVAKLQQLQQMMLAARIDAMPHAAAGDEHPADAPA